MRGSTLLPTAAPRDTPVGTTSTLAANILNARSCAFSISVRKAVYSCAKNFCSAAGSVTVRAPMFSVVSLAIGDKYAINVLADTTARTFIELHLYSPPQD